MTTARPPVTHSAVAARSAACEVYTIGENEKLDAALDLMEEKLVRRLPVVDDDGRLAGIISQADLVSRVATLKVARVMRSVSKKTRRHAAAAI